MKTLRGDAGRFPQRPYFSDREIEKICADELRKVGLYPSHPEPVRIERFIEKRFKVSPTYAELPDGVLGFTKFDTNGVREVVIAARGRIGKVGLRSAAPLSPIKPNLPWHAYGSMHLEDELASEMARLAQPVRVAGLRQTIQRDLRSAYRTRLKQLADSIEMPARASDRRAKRLHVVALGLGRLWAGSDKSRASARLEYREGLLRHITADGIEDRVAIGHDLREIVGVVIVIFHQPQCRGDSHGLQRSRS